MPLKEFDNKEKKEYGEFECPYCDRIFFEHKKLSGHIGGAHRRNITLEGPPTCKFCNSKLIENKNWPKWAVKQRNLICIKCKRIQNRISYRNKNKRINTYRNKFKELKNK